MDQKYDFSGWATRNDLVCTDGRTIRKDAFKHCDGKIVPLVWNHQHNDPDNVLGHALLENRHDGVYAYCSFNDTDSGKTAKALVQHGDVESLSIYANGLTQSPTKDVMHGDIREVSLVVAGANPGAFIDFVDMAHGEGGEQEVIISAYEPISLYHSDEKPPLKTKKKEDEEPAKEDPKPEEKPKEDPKPEEKPAEKPEKEETVQDVVDSMTDKQRTVMYALIGAAMEQQDPDDGKGEGAGPSKSDKSDKTEGGNKNMKHNVFENDEPQETVLSHADRTGIIALAKQSSVGSLRTAMNIYAEEHDELKHGIENIESLFPDYKLLRPGAPELVSRDQGWVNMVINKVHKSPISRIRTHQMDARANTLRGHGYTKGSKKKTGGDMALISRTTDPQTVYVINVLNRDDIIDITDFDVVEYQYSVMKENLNEEVAMAIMVGDGREAGSEQKISEDHIRSIWNDNEMYTIHKDIDMAEVKADLQGTNTGANFGDNYIYAESIISSSLTGREDYRGTGTPDFFCTPHLLNVMLLARDLNGRRIYNSKSDLVAALNVGDIYTAQQFEGLTRLDTDGGKHKLLGIFVNLQDYTVGSTKGGEISRFDQFDIDFNQQKYLIETRLSGALTRVSSAVVLEEKVGASSEG